MAKSFFSKNSNSYWRIDKQINDNLSLMNRLMHDDCGVCKKPITTTGLHSLGI